MNYFQAVILSIVEGISEFLPISSTGHLNITRDLLGIQSSAFFTNFEIIIQLGAILAVVVLYFNRVISNKLIWKKVLIAFLPTAIVGFIFQKIILNYLVSSSYITIVSLFAGGIILIILELLYKEKEHHIASIEDIPYKNAFLIGVFQSIAVIPGVSRSAATIVSALFLGTKRKAAVEFSFLLAVPTMTAATALDLVHAKFNFSPNEFVLLLIGFLGSFIVGIFAIKFLLGFIRNHTFIPFGIYRIVAAVVFWYILIK